MDFEIDIKELRTRKIFIATPMYGAQCSGFYMKSLLDLQIMLTKHNVDSQFFAIFNESLITRARNYCVDTFMRSGCTHLMFIDADIEFDPMDVIGMMALSSPESDKHVLCGPYPKKNISWEKVKKAVDKGIADENPSLLEYFAGDFVFNPLKSGNFMLDEPQEVLEGGTGFMLIQRKVFEKFSEAYPERHYLPDHIRTKDFDGSRDIVAYFDCVIDPKSRRYLSEDYMFCQYARDLGFHVWMCPWMKLNHVGNIKFMGDVRAVAAVGAALTADPKLIKNMKT